MHLMRWQYYKNDISLDWYRQRHRYRKYLWLSEMYTGAVKENATVSEQEKLC